MVADMIIRLPSTPLEKYQPITMKAQCCENELFATGRVKKISFPTIYLECEKEQQKDMGDKNPKIGTYITYCILGYYKQVLDEVELI